MVERTLDPEDRVTQFEALTAAAYWELARAGVEVAAVEAGLGGRYDATSVIRSAVQVLTNVSLEHTRWLGPTERTSREEKLAVVPTGGTAGRRAARPGGAAGRGSESSLSAAHGCCCWDVTSADPRGASCARAAPSSERTSLSRWRRREAFARCARPRTGARGGRSVAHAGPARGGGRTSRSRSWTARTTLPGAAALAGALVDVVEGRRTVGVMSVLDDKDASAMLATLLPLFGAGRVHALLARRARCRPRRSRACRASSAARPSRSSPRRARRLQRARELARAGRAPCSSPAPYTCCPTWPAPACCEGRRDAARPHAGPRRDRGRGRDPRCSSRSATASGGCCSSAELRFGSGHRPSGTLCLAGIPSRRAASVNDASPSFGIENDGLNLAVNLLVFFLFVIWRRARLLDVRGREPAPRRPDAGRLRHRGLAVPLHRDDRLHDRAPARVPRGPPRARARGQGRREAARAAREPHLPQLRRRGRADLPALPELHAQAEGAVPRAAASRSTRAGGSALTARPRSPASLRSAAEPRRGRAPGAPARRGRRGARRSARAPASASPTASARASTAGHRADLDGDPARPRRARRRSRRPNR